MNYRLTEDASSKRLRIEVVSRTRLLIPRLLVTGVGLLFLVGFLGILVFQFIQMAPAGWMQRPDVWGKLLLAMGIMGVPAGWVVFRGLSSLGSHQAPCRELLFDGSESEFIATIDPPALWASRYWKASFSDIESIEIENYPRTPNTFKLAVRFSSDRNLDEFVGWLTVAGIDQREELLDLLLRIGNIVGIASYEVLEQGLRDYRIQLTRHPKASRAKSVPVITESADYERDQVASAVTKPTMKIAQFDRKSFEKNFESYKLISWEPGKRIHILRPGMSIREYFALACVFGVIGFGLGYFIEIPFLKLTSFNRGALVAVVLSLGMTIEMYRTSRELEFIWDWPSGVFGWRISKRSQSAPLSEIETLQLRGLRTTRTEGSGSSSRSVDFYSCRLEMVVAGRTLHLVETQVLERSDDEVPVRQLSPLTNALAESLGVPWKWIEYK